MNNPFKRILHRLHASPFWLLLLLCTLVLMGFSWLVIEGRNSDESDDSSSRQASAVEEDYVYNPRDPSIDPDELDIIGLSLEEFENTQVAKDRAWYVLGDNQDPDHEQLGAIMLTLIDGRVASYLIIGDVAN